MTYGPPWVCADTHFSHLGVCKFLGDDGVKIRPWTDPAEMDEALVANWNAVVGDGDRVYLAGDVAINKKGLKILDRMNGRKVLVKGNHDIFKLRDYVPYFEDVRACVVRQFKGGEGRAILTHIPIHTRELERFRMNIHGHLHEKRVTLDRFLRKPKIDPRYVCVSVEQTGFAPVSMERVMEEGRV